MNTLFIDTHAKNVLIILFKDGKILDKIDIETMNKHSVVTMPSIRTILTNNKMDVKDLNDIIVCNGPGSFTGSRIAVTIAKTIAYSLNIPIKQIDAITIKAVNVKTDKDYFVSIKDRNGAYVGKYNKDCKLLDELSYISNSEYAMLSTEDLYEEVEVDYEVVYEYLSTTDYINVHSIKPIYVKGISALNDK
jgi:tRNA threonylcarbamoyl adenosine modification protein YeaZ